MLFVADKAKERILQVMQKEGFGNDYFVRDNTYFPSVI